MTNQVPHLFVLYKFQLKKEMENLLQKKRPLFQKKFAKMNVCLNSYLRDARWDVRNLEAVTKNF